LYYLIKADKQISRNAYEKRKKENKNEREIITNQREREKKMKMNDTNESHRQQVFTYD